MLEVRKKLPSYEMRDEIVDTIRNNQVVVLSGETGECWYMKLAPHFPWCVYYSYTRWELGKL